MDSLKHLLTCKDDTHTAMVMELLSDKGIPVIKKYDDLDSYRNIAYNMTLQGTHLLVDASDYDRAVSLVQAIHLPLQTVPSADDDMAVLKVKQAKKSHILGIVFTVIFLAPALIMLVASLFN